MGDWNIDMSDPRDPDYKSLREFIDAESLQLIETGPTHHTEGRDTWIDLLLVDQNDVVLKSDHLPPPFRSRHDIVSLQIEHFIPSILPATLSYRKYSSVSSTDICAQLNTCDWELFAQPEGQLDVESGLAQLTEHLQTALDELAPVKTVRIKKKKPPWISSEIGILMSKRDATNNKYLRTGHRPTLDKFLRLGELVEMQTDAARCAYMHTKIEEAIGENKNVWLTKENFLSILSR